MVNEDPFGTKQRMDDLLRSFSSFSLADQILEYERSLYDFASIGHDYSELFSANWQIAAELLETQSILSLDLGFESQSSLNSILEDINRPILKPYRDDLLDDLALGASSLMTLRDVSAGVDPESLFVSQSRLLSDSFTTFFQHILSDEHSGALEIAAVSAAADNLRLSSVSMALIPELSSASGEYPFNPVIPNWFDVLRRDISEFTTEDESSEMAALEQQISSSEPGQVSTIAANIIDVRYRINVDSETSKGEPIFKPTTKGEHAAGMLGLVVVENRESFEQFAERLYFFLYEASGSWKRISAYGIDFPIVADRIKHLRLYAAHDTQHGSDTEIRTKALQVGDHLEQLCGQRVPSSSSQWRKAQLELLREVESFLTELHQAVVSISPSA